MHSRVPKHNHRLHIVTQTSQDNHCLSYVSKARWPLGSLGGPEAKIWPQPSKNQTWCFPSLAVQEGGWSNDNKHVLGSHTLLWWLPGKRLKANALEKTILVNIFPWVRKCAGSPYLGVFSVKKGRGGVGFQNGCCTLWFCMQTNDSLVITILSTSLLTCKHLSSLCSG